MRAKIWTKDREATYDEVNDALIDGRFSGHSIGYDNGRFVYFGKITSAEFRRAMQRLSVVGLIE